MWQKLFDVSGIKERKSTLADHLKYPTLRDHPARSWQNWLDGRRADDGAEGLWRVHDKLYDVTTFIDQHPGGDDWLQLTKGTDITEAFEAHHIKPLAEKMLHKYYVRNAKTRRNSPFTFDDAGFFRTLKRNVRDELKKVPKGPVRYSKLIIDSLLGCFLIGTIFAACFKSYWCAIFAGVTMSMMSIAAHNFFHQRNNFRMYYFDLSMLSSRGWRVSHALSHHLFPNTLMDLEISGFEPLMQYLPTRKGFFFRYVSWAYSLIFFATLFIISYIRLIKSMCENHGKGLQFVNLFPMFILALIWYLNSDFLNTTQLFLTIYITGSFHFAFVGLNAAHHHPDLFHDGDEPRSKNAIDWGIYQLDSVMDRKEITGSHFLVLTHFGDHALHHMFPTLDCGLLDPLYPLFLEICKQFDVKWNLSTQIDMIKGHYRQLAKTVPKKYQHKK